MLRKCRLIEFESKMIPFRGEYYFRTFLKFEITFLGLFKKSKTITYDVTMFQDYTSYKDNWQNMIDTKILVPYSIIKDNKIF